MNLNCKLSDFTLKKNWTSLVPLESHESIQYFRPRKFGPNPTPHPTHDKKVGGKFTTFLSWVGRGVGFGPNLRVPIVSHFNNRQRRIAKKKNLCNQCHVKW